MRIGIITFHFVQNQGAVLQCYAMQKFLEKHGHEAFVIDYRPKYHTVRYDSWKNPFIYAKWYSKRLKTNNYLRRIYVFVRAFTRSMYYNIKGTDKKSSQLFTDFVKNNLHLSDTYITLKQLQAHPPKSDAYISGSDQLWNIDLLDQDFDPAYFLDFGQADTKRITYAVSIGKLPEKSKLAQLKSLCAKLTAVSLRESDSEAIDAIGKDVTICLDPTFLLDAEDYAEIETENSEKEPYIFVYGFETNSDIQQAVELAVKRYGCRVINGSPTRIKLEGDIVNMKDYAPDRFLTLIKNAECVVTNSFHGTAFSVIYKKRFITVPHSTRGKRMTELLEKIGLECCLWGSSNFSFENEADYSAATEKLYALREKSVDYLNNALK